MTPDADPAALAAEILRALGSGEYALSLVVAVLAATIVVRRYGARIPWLGPRIGPWLATPVGAVTVAVVGSVAGALGTALLAGEPFSAGLILRALGVAVVALLPSAATQAKAKGDEAAGKVVDLNSALAELNKPRYMGAAVLEAERKAKDESDR